MNRDFNIKNKPIIIFIILVLILFIIISFFFSFTSSKIASISESTENNYNIPITNQNLLSDTFLNDTNSTIIASLQKILFILHPNQTTAKIKEDTLIKNDEDIHFSIITEDNFSVLISFSNNILLIKNLNDEEIFYYDYKIFDNNTYISPYLLNDDFFPYQTKLSNGDTIQAKISNDNLTIKITVDSCISDELKNESIATVKNYIKKINSNPNFFSYSIETLCF